MDPLSIAMTSFSAIKAGVAAGKEIHSLTKDIGQLWGAIDQIKSDHNSKKSSAFASAEEEALSTFIAKKQAEDMENELRQIVMATRGISGWQELVRLRTEIKVRQKEEREAKAKRRHELIEHGFIAFGIFALGIGLLGVVFFIVKLRGH